MSIVTRDAENIRKYPQLQGDGVLIAAFGKSNLTFHRGVVHQIPRREREMDAEKVISEIETLERIFALADSRPPAVAQLPGINQEHDQKLAHNPWFQLWKRYGK